MTRPRVAWVLGCREGSNLTALYLRACGAALPIVEPRPGNSWNDVWAEDNRALTLATRVFGMEEKLHVQRQWRPPHGDPGWGHLPELLAHFRDHATAPLTVYKFGCLPHVWPEVAAALPDAAFEHQLVCCERDHDARLGSLMRLNPQATRSEVAEFVSRHADAKSRLVAEFHATGRLVVHQPLAREALARTARALGLEPTAEAEALWRDR